MSRSLKSPPVATIATGAMLLLIMFWPSGAPTVMVQSVTAQSPEPVESKSALEAPSAAESAQPTTPNPVPSAPAEKPASVSPVAANTTTPTAAYSPLARESGYGSYHDYRPEDDQRATYPDSIKYYGPAGYWERISRDKTLQRGRDTWWFYTAGNERFYRALSNKVGQLGFSVDFLRLLDSRRRKERFAELGLINEPGYRQADKPNELGLWLDQPTEPLKRDPLLPADPAYPSSEQDVADYGYPTGIIGLRMFKNPSFTDEMEKTWKEQWKKLEAEGKNTASTYEASDAVKTYFQRPGLEQPPFLVGITCAFCHVAFDPLNPPKDQANPRWDNLSANLGNQYFREGDLFFGWGRIVGGNAIRTPGLAGDEAKQERARKLAIASKDPYQTDGLGPDNLLYQYGHLQQSGTSETSRFSYDFINNPNTINQIFFLSNRAGFHETAPDGRPVTALHILKDGADSAGVLAALGRVFVNIGGESEYWLDRLWDPLTGSGPYPFSLEEVRGGPSVPEWRRQELKEKYPRLGESWKGVEARLGPLAAYLIGYDRPFKLEWAVRAEKARAGQDAARLAELDKLLPDPQRARRGANLFGKYCAQCHSSKQPFYPLQENEGKALLTQLASAPDFLENNTLSSDARYPVTRIGTNAGRAFATNAIEGEIWSDFSSKEYKALPSVGTLQFQTPLHLLSPQFGPGPIVTSFVAPGNGRGYYRPASLVGLWTSAPYLHNNSLGRDPYQERFADDVSSVSKRVQMFEESIRQLLHPQQRRGVASIKLTTQESTLLGGLEAEKKVLLARIVWQVIRPRLYEKATTIIEKKIVNKSAQEIAKAALAEALEQVEPKLPELISLISEADETVIKMDIQKLILQAKTQAQMRVKQKIPELLPKVVDPVSLPNLPAILGILDEVVEALHKDEGKLELENLVPAGVLNLFTGNLRIPAGTPINLILNQNLRRAPYAVAAFEKYKDDPRKLAEELLRLSDCPDLVEDKGHLFPTMEERSRDSLTNEDFEDLIQFLKTL